MTQNYCFVLDDGGNKLAPTSENKGWYLIRKGKATLKNKYPMVIQLNRTVEYPQSHIRLGIDDGSKHIGIALVQEGKNSNKVIFKATLEHRNDVKKKMNIRRGERRYRRSHKRYRPARFDNRASSQREGRLAPSILQKKQAIVRLAKKLIKWVNVDSIYLEDVTIDIRALTDGYKPYRWEYQRSNRLDENIRKAILIRDDHQCMHCGKKNCRLEVHHIVAKRYRGSDTQVNLITLCEKCHQKTEGREEEFVEFYQSLIKGRNIRLDNAQHVVQGKKWLRSQLALIAPLKLTSGGDTANKRIDWSIEKTHVNDAVVITGLKPRSTNVKEWVVKPIRRKIKGKYSSVCGFKYRDLAAYTDRKGIKHIGYVTAMYPDKLQVNIQTPVKHVKRANARKSQLVWRFKSFYFL